MLTYETLTDKIIGAAIEVHRHIGPGHLESLYRECLSAELTLQKITHATEVRCPINYKGLVLDRQYRIDMLIDGTVIVELKAVEQLHPVHEAQLLTYMRLANKPVGLLLNFNVPLLKNGLIRRVL